MHCPRIALTAEALNTALRYTFADLNSLFTFRFDERLRHVAHEEQEHTLDSLGSSTLSASLSAVKGRLFVKVTTMITLS